MVTILDDFEDGDMSEYSGATGEYGISTERAREGNESLYYSGGGNNANIGRTDVTVSQGDRISYWFNVVNEGDLERPTLKFGLQDASALGIGITAGGSCYHAKVQYDTDEIWIERIDSGSNNDLQGTSCQVADSQWYRGEIEWETDGTITFTVYSGGSLDQQDGTQEAQVSTTDSTYTSGGIGMYDYDTFTYYDYIWKESMLSAPAQPTNLQAQEI